MFNLGLKHAIALRKLTGTVCSLFYMAAGTCSKVNVVINRYLLKTGVAYWLPYKKARDARRKFYIIQ